MKPLDGITVLDLSRVLAAPLGTMILAEFGATVIKVEQPGDGDELRVNEPYIKGESAYFFAANRSKRSITANLKHPEGRDMVRSLAAKADLFVENFTVGTMQRVGLDYESLKKINPKLVYVSASGFGQTGPYASRKGYDTVFQAMTGMMALTGEPDGPPVKAGLPTADLTSGLWVAIACLIGLFGRKAGDQGVYIDYSMMDGQVSLLAVAAARFFALGEVPKRMGTQHIGRVPSSTFQCGDGKWLHITCGEKQWPRLCAVLGIEEWGKSPLAATGDARIKNRAAVMAYLSEKLQSWKRNEFVERCAEADVPAGPVNEVDEVLADPQVVARGVVQHFNHPTVGSFPGLALPMKLTGMDGPEFGVPPLHGQHTDEILSGWLGYTPEKIQDLREKGAI